MDIAIQKRNITPDKACFMGGYERQQKSIGVLDEIDMISCVMKFDKEILIFCSIDTICIEKEFRDALADYCKEEYGICDDQFNLSCIHTHSGPAIFKLPTCNEACEGELKQQVFGYFKEDLAICMNSLQEVTCTYRTGLIDGCYGNRNIIGGSQDKEVFTMTFYQQEKAVAMLVNMACHPTILNGDNLLLSSDLLGNIREQLSAYYHVPVILFNGACGDVSTRFYRENQQSNVVELTAKKVVKQIISHKEEPIEMNFIGKAAFGFKTVFDIEHDNWTNREIKRMQQDLNNDSEKYRFEKNLLHRLEIKMKMRKIECDLMSHAYIFDKLLILTIPGELVSKVGLALKQKYHDYHVILIAYCNNYVSYLVNQEDYGQYFESYVAITEKGTVETLINGITAKIDQRLINK